MEEEFDFDPQKCTNNPPMPTTERIGVMDLKHEIYSESEESRKTRMLKQLERLVRSCSLCELGRKPCDDRDSRFDPHVFSTMNPQRWMIVGQNPGFNECMKGEPFVGDAGKLFDMELEKHGLSRENFYITNSVHCYTKGNEPPSTEQIRACSNLLRLELAVIDPKLVVTLGAQAFSIFCPREKYSDSLGKIVVSSTYHAKVFPIYHPSPRNMCDLSRKIEFSKCVKTLCKLIKTYESRSDVRQ